MKLAPICLFTYNRLALTRQTVEALQRNFLAGESELFVFSDGPKSVADVIKINELRAYLQTLSGFKSITIYEQESNRGLANSIIQGVTQVIAKYGTVIVLEDDLVTSPNFLDFMNQALDSYQNHEQIFSISGFTLNLPSLKNLNVDYYVGYRASSWGWATWVDRWSGIDWEINKYVGFLSDRENQRAFNKNRGSDMTSLLKARIQGKNNSWAIIWCFNQFKAETFTIFPSISKVFNIGFGAEASHTGVQNRFPQKLDTSTKTNFLFSSKISVEKIIIRDFLAVYSVFNRVKWKIKHIAKRK